MGILDLLKPAPLLEEIQDKEDVKKQYKYWRFRIFYGMYIGYAFYYFTRKSFTFAMPALMQDLGFDKSDLGILGSILYISYGFSKFLSGIISDRSNPRYFMAVGLIMTGVLNILFGMTSSIVFFAFFWGLNGLFQGWGWPPCARLLTHWYSQTERGTWWGIWNTSHNVGGALIPLLAAFCISYFGWRYAMYIPGVMCIIVGIFLINRLRDTPQSLGLPSIEKFRNDYPRHTYDNNSEKELTAKEILFEYVLKNKFIWVLAFAYFCIYIIRIAINDWGQLFLYEAKGYSLLSASSCVFWFEIGGFLSSVTCGWASDKMFAGKRGPINVIFSVGAALSIATVWLIPANSLGLHSFAMFMTGFFIFGPQMLIGMAAAELSHKKAAGTATGFTGWFAYFGAAIAGYPFGKIAQDYGWYGFFVVLAGCAIAAVLLLTPLWSVKNNPRYSQKNPQSTS